MPLDSDGASGEAHLTARGVVVPTDHRTEWCASWGLPGRLLEVWSDSPGQCVCTLVVEVNTSRALPLHQIWRVDRFGGYDDPTALEAALVGLAAFAQADRRVVEVTVGLTAPEDEVRRRLVEAARSLGFGRTERPRNYERTLRIDLTQGSEGVLAGMSASCRRAVRAPARGNLQVRTIEEPAAGQRIASILRETMRRTGGPTQDFAWSRIVQYAREHPDSARLVGTFDGEGGPPHLLAFALGLRQGDCVEYRAAGSTRSAVTAPLGYAPAFDLMEWGIGNGAGWFDFGGLPRPGAVDPSVAGIVRFKESFGGTPIELREEWTLETRPLLGFARRAAAAGARWLRSAARPR